MKKAVSSPRNAESHVLFLEKSIVIEYPAEVLFAYFSFHAEYLFIYLLIYPYLRTCSLILEKGEGRVRERKGEGEKHQCERETSIHCLLYAPRGGTEPSAAACALTRNRTITFWFMGWCSNQLSHTDQGHHTEYLKDLYSRF